MAAGDELDYHPVGHGSAAIHEVLCLQPQLRAFRDMPPEHVAGREVRDAVDLGQAVARGSLARPGWGEEQGSQHGCLPIAGVEGKGERTGAP